MRLEQVVYVIWALAGFGLLNVLFRVLRNRGMAGAMLGAPVERTVGELDLGRRNGLRKRLKVLVLRPTDKESPAIGIQVVTSTYVSVAMSVIPLTRSQALRMRALLSEAIGPPRAEDEAG